MTKPGLRKFLYKFEPDVLDPPNLIEIASRKGWTTKLAGPLVVQVERDILTFDSFAAVAELSNGLLQFGGGTLLNWVYAGLSLRFSFDIDSQILESKITKQEILSELLLGINGKLRENEKVVTIPFAGKNVEIGTIEYDKEKDHFSNVLSLKRRVFSFTVGTEAHISIRRELGLTGDVSKASVRRKKYFGGLFPRIDDVKIEIGIPESREQIFPWKTIEVRPFVYPEVRVESVTQL